MIEYQDYIKKFDLAIISNEPNIIYSEYEVCYSWQIVFI